MSSKTFAIEKREVRGAVVVYAALQGKTSLNVIDADIAASATLEFRDIVERYEPRCVILTGRDDKAFIGGADLRTLQTLNQDTAEAFIRSIHDFCTALYQAPVPVIAALQGYCLGAGLEIAASCDLRVGDYSVRCGMPEVRVGMPSVIEAAFIPLLVGWGKAREILLRGHIIDADEAANIGLLQHLVAVEKLDEILHDISGDIVNGAPEAIAAQKQLCSKWANSSLKEAIEHGVPTFVEAFRSDEPREYIERFFSKRSD